MLHKVIGLTATSAFQLVLRTIIFIYLANILSLTAIGYFTLTITIASIAVNLISFGGYNLVMARAASENDIHDFLQFEVKFYLINFCIFLFGFVVVHQLLELELPLISGVKILVGETLQVGFLFILSSYFLARNNTAILNVLRTINTLFYAMMFFIYVSITDRSFTTWANLYLITSIIFFFYGIYYIMRGNNIKFENDISSFIIKYRIRILDGGGFFVSSSVRAIFTASDKVLISTLLGYQAVGIYSLAEKCILALNVPAASYLSLNEPRYYQQGANIDKYKVCIKVISVIAIYFIFLYFTYEVFGHNLFVIIDFPERFYEPFLLLNTMLLYVLSTNYFNSYLHFLNGVGQVKVRISITLLALLVFASSSYFTRYLYGDFDLSTISIIFAVTQLVICGPWYLYISWKLCCYPKTT
ncbi:lipopolysaccharide biosynthesis protein [Vibrio alginolyticus]|uniref:lipopolysaccharide biosynthesis protein n=1 Tax=Vibrio alginolyticus TaxID=663 RepID=UPI001BD3FF94|nr:oligosaccharide flippase family protein [Vibrio alginolyticus]MBT0033707.1 oligosaccharide flippase family protein [Vibrio alginolyticus]